MVPTIVYCWKNIKCLEGITESHEAHYQAEIANELIPISRWYRESVRNGNGEAIEGVWMLLPAIYAQIVKTNYRDESLTHLTNVLAKWPLAYTRMYQRMHANAQTSFSILEIMWCSSNILEMNRKMYKSREAFDIHRTKKHQKPSSLYDLMKVAQFAIREKWFETTSSPVVKKYPLGDKVVKEDETVSAKYLNAVTKGEQ